MAAVPMQFPKQERKQRGTGRPRPGVDVAPLTPSTVDGLARQYLALKLEQESLDKRAKDVRERLLKLIEEHGVTPTKAEKSKRVEGEEYSVTATFGQSISVDQMGASAMAKAMAFTHGYVQFSRLFEIESRYILTKDALAIMSGKLSKEWPRNARTMFQRALKITNRQPSISVEEK